MKLRKLLTRMMAIRLIHRRRFSVLVDDPGFETYDRICREGGHVDVFCDGKRQRFVVTADEKTGVITRHAHDENGRLIRDEADNVVSETIRGKVRIHVL